MLISKCFRREMCWKLALPSWGGEGGLVCFIRCIYSYLSSLCLLLEGWLALSNSKGPLSNLWPVQTWSAWGFSIHSLSPYLHTWQYKREYGLTKSGIIYLCAPHILCVLYRPGVRRLAHPAKQSWQCISKRKRWLSDLRRSCAHLIILLKEHMDFLFLVENKHTPVEYPMKFWTHTQSRDHVPGVLAHGNFLSIEPRIPLV